MSPKHVLILPGINNSGPEHWQTLWQAEHPSFERVQARDWTQPRCDDWVNALEAAVRSVGQDVWLIAHSLGCLQVAHWAARHPHAIAGAFLVAPPDPAAACFPTEAEGFAPVPKERLPFPSLVVASANDPYGCTTFAQQVANVWGSRFQCVGEAGHINAGSALGRWPEGLALWHSFVAETTARR